MIEVKTDREALNYLNNYQALSRVELIEVYNYIKNNYLDFYITIQDRTDVNNFVNKSKDFLQEVVNGQDQS